MQYTNNKTYSQRLDSVFKEYTDKIIIENEEVKKEEEALIIQQLKDAYVNPFEEIKPPEIALKQVSKDINKSDSIIATLGNIMSIIGKAKSRKSFLTAMFIASMLSDSIINRLKSTLPHNKRKVILADTEQGRYHVQLYLKRILSLLGINQSENLEVYALRKYKPSERLKILEYKVYNTANLGCLVIDGIKDLITSINDEEQATMIVSKLMKWSEELNISIIVILHQNKSDNNARGHIGTELINKSETVLSVTKSEGDNDISIVEPEQCRNKDFESFAFEILEGLPKEAENFEIRTQKKSTKIDFEDIEDFKLFSMLNQIYAKESSFHYTNLVIQMKLAFKKQFQKSIGTNKAKELITHCKNNDWIIQDGLKQPYTLGTYKA